MKNKYDTKNIAEYILKKIPVAPEISIILGSGLSEFTSTLTNPVNVPYSEISEYPQPSVSGHVGEFIFGFAGNTPVLCARGRFHYYEGHSIETVTLPLRVFHDIQCKSVIITNAAGCMNRDWNTGELMVIDGHFDFTFRHSSSNPPLMDTLLCYDKNLLLKAKDIAKSQSLLIRKGKYCWTLGPTYETPAEIEYMHALGGDAVGMSTVPEIEEADKLGLKVLGISCLTNYAAGISSKPLTHLEVLETTERVKSQFADLITGIIVN
ncbi:MAG: purine-nucleoside phosphorylase [Candidatus Marinimicrobia bacterium]|nr:purine-nucleoside phosphorylase [Candidatus Neomarinimicrobiota bacterium]MBT3633143.1 purine-nucleoside phosphorylase [Candidatus Neomarinimicrobiota bacterium]MBT3682256.1 purine-nucleoside phosphorylase [Candidatus Neomarinimicrobiota bacterium]MBT3758743.1 purine-nucleoside phosphorylase [Candidatus Neomarinimicrobiota bacterium]MBT3895383.1 purine-nucleoside phosphorylase [Candidatus Neomarinimicrobiota bacterium]